MANPNWKLLLLRALLIIAAGFWVFSPALHGDWLMDDDVYLTQNVLLNDPARLAGMRVAAVENAVHRTPQCMADKVLAVYYRALAG